MLKQYNFRIDVKDINQIDKMEGSRSYNIRNAIQSYINNNKSNPSDNIYNVDLIQILKDQVEDLKQDKNNLQQRLDYYMLPWYMRIITTKNRLLTEHKE